MWQGDTKTSSHRNGCLTWPGSGKTSLSHRNRCSTWPGGFLTLKGVFDDVTLTRKCYDFVTVPVTSYVICYLLFVYMHYGTTFVVDIYFSFV